MCACLCVHCCSGTHEGSQNNPMVVYHTMSQHPGGPTEAGKEYSICLAPLHVNTESTVFQACETTSTQNPQSSKHLKQHQHKTNSLPSIRNSINTKSTVFQASETSTQNQQSSKHLKQHHHKTNSLPSIRNSINTKSTVFQASETTSTQNQQSSKHLKQHQHKTTVFQVSDSSKY